MADEVTVNVAVTEQTLALTIASPQGPAGPQGIQGIQGEQGVQGETGAEGDSAYEVAVENGFVGTEADWLDSLVGPQGPQGIQGEPGAVQEVGADTGIVVLGTAANPIVGLSAGVLASLALADTAVQPGDLADVAFSGAYGDLTGKPTIPTSGSGGYLPYDSTTTYTRTLLDDADAFTARETLGLGAGDNVSFLSVYAEGALGIGGLGGGASYISSSATVAQPINIPDKSGYIPVVGSSSGLIDLVSEVTNRLTLNNFTTGLGYSVLGRSVSSTGQMSLMIAGDKQVFRREGTTLGFGAIDLTSAAAVTGRLGVGNFALGSALSVFGRSANSSGGQASIAASANGQVLRVASDVLGFGALDLADSDAVTGELADGNIASADVWNGKIGGDPGDGNVVPRSDGVGGLQSSRMSIDDNGVITLTGAGMVGEMKMYYGQRPDYPAGDAAFFIVPPAGRPIFFGDPTTSPWTVDFRYTAGLDGINNLNAAGVSFSVTSGPSHCLRRYGNDLQIGASGGVMDFRYSSSFAGLDAMSSMMQINEEAINAINVPFRSFGAFTSYTNFEGIEVGHTGSEAYIDSVAGSIGGTVRNLVLKRGGVDQIIFDGAHINFAALSAVAETIVCDYTAVIKIGADWYKIPLQLQT